MDAIARYKRLEGYNVLFPVGTHATGNGAISLAARSPARTRRPSTTCAATPARSTCWTRSRTRVKVVEFFNEVYVNQYWKRFGFLGDWRRFTSTIYPDYRKFIQWQFRKLMEKGLLIQKPYYAPACVAHGPVAIDASETDIQCGGCAETIEYTLLKFKCGDMYLMAATLRPETVFGQTNFWVNPEVEYVKVRVGRRDLGGQPRSPYDKMTLPEGRPGEDRSPSKGSELIGLNCIAPMVHREILTLPADFCDPDVGTGLVTSVPSDSPDDWISLRALQKDEATLVRYGLDVEEVRAITPIAIIETKGWSSLPAVEVTERMGITAPGDPKLEEAKKLVYKDGFHTGRMNDTAGEYAGLPVMEAKDRMKQAMMSIWRGRRDVRPIRTGHLPLRRTGGHQEGRRPVVHRLRQPRGHRRRQRTRQEHGHPASGVLSEHTRRPGLVPGTGLRASGQLDRYALPVRREVDHRGHIRFHAVSDLLHHLQVRQRRVAEAGADDRGVLRPGGAGQGRHGRGERPRPGFPRTFCRRSGTRSTTGTPWTSTWAARST